MKEFARLLGFLKPYRAIFALSVVLMIATGLLDGATGLLLVPIFDLMTPQQAAGHGGVSGALGFLELKRYLPSGGAEAWGTIALMLVGFTLAKGVTEYFSSYSMSYIGQNVIADVRAKLYAHITRQAAKFFAKHPTNELTAHLMSDAALVERAVSDTLRDLLRESVSLIVYLVLL